MSIPPSDFISQRSLLKYLEAARVALEQEGYEDPAHYFEMMHDAVSRWSPSKPFTFKSADLGL